MNHPLTWIIVAAVLVTQVATFSTTIYLHRGLAHLALKFRGWVDVVFRSVLWITTGQKRREWVAVHRKHHTFTDREGDPHSPRLFGFWRVQLLNVVFYMREARKQKTLETFAPDIVDDKWDERLFNRGRLGPILGIMALCGVMSFKFGLWGILWGVLTAALHLGLYVFFVAPIINALGHWVGWQNYKNTAFNHPELSWLTGGESLHNNHHDNPTSPKFSSRWFELDPAWPVIRLMKALRLART